MFFQLIALVVLVIGVSANGAYGDGYGEVYANDGSGCRNAIRSAVNVDGFRTETFTSTSWTTETMIGLSTFDVSTTQTSD